MVFSRQTVGLACDRRVCMLQRPHSCRIWRHQQVLHGPQRIYSLPQASHHNTALSARLSLLQVLIRCRLFSKPAPSAVQLIIVVTPRQVVACRRTAVLRASILQQHLSSLTCSQNKISPTSEECDDIMFNPSAHDAVLCCAAWLLITLQSCLRYCARHKRLCKTARHTVADQNEWTGCWHIL